SSNFMEKLQQSICRSCVATSGKADPSRSRRKNLDAIIPARSFGRQSHHFSEDGPRKRFREVAEGPFPHGGDNISRCTFVGENEPEPMCTGEPNVFPEDTNSVQGDRLDIPPELLLLPV